MGRGRPGGNPDFGTKFKFDFGNEEKRDKPLTIRFSASEIEKLKEIAGDRYRDFCREVILKAVSSGCND
ncbi:MAG: hypothetical protein KME57_26260 [Scytonema hyalinum WJT4-NPBG1]|jgi:predicted DNA binding CopG/RHH family protein|nr:hypothetical protein SD81_016950 [Tolypothrix campylonemoides VB511288]MBW4502972.1 hypothetical protein [Scytonema hyalinum WJT4-NPBG1]